jgi:hypothetical protein
MLETVFNRIGGTTQVIPASYGAYQVPVLVVFDKPRLSQLVCFLFVFILFFLDDQAVSNVMGSRFLLGGMGIDSSNNLVIRGHAGPTDRVGKSLLFYLSYYCSPI